ncbi:MAG: PAS domain S-box protein [Leptolyngbya sp. SIO1D8]|nr:PAS domain S-box protein [Leptolyngbya sp. SIO1D8]
MLLRTMAYTLVELKSAIVRNPLVVSPDARVSDAIAQMTSLPLELTSLPTTNNPLEDMHLQVRASCVVVVEGGGQIVGILTERDIVHLSTQQQPLSTLWVSQVMTHPVVTLQESDFTHFLVAMNLLQRHRIRHLPVLDDQDRLIGIITYESLQQASNYQQLQTELNQRQQIEALLFESEQRYASLAAAAPVGIFRTNDQGFCTYVNGRYCQITGISPEAAIGQGWQQVLYPEDNEMVIAEWYQSVHEKRPFQIECRCQRPSGEVRWVYAQSVTERDADGQVVGYVGTLTDISERARLEAERQQAEAALRESEARWQFALEGAGDGVWDWNLQTNQLFFSRQWKTMLGYAEADVGNRLEDWESRVYPDDKAQCYIELNKHFNGEISVYQNEYRMRCKDGCYKWVLTRGKVIKRDKNGNPLRMIGTHTDISDRKQAELALQQSEAQIRAVLAAIPDYLFRVNADGVFRDIITPNHKSSLIPRNFDPSNQAIANVLPEDIATQHQHYLEQALITGKLQIYEQQLHEGDNLHIEEVRVIKSGEDEVLFMIRDITDRKRAEFALKQSELTNRIIVDTIPDLLIQMDLQGYYSRMSGGSGVQVKYPSATSTGPDIYTVLPPELAEQRLYYTHQALESGTLKIYEQVFDLDGDQRCEEVRIAPLNDEEVLIIIRDVTERKQAEQQLQNLVAGTAATTGHNFFPALITYIVKAFNVSHALVTEKTGNRLQTLALWSNDALQETDLNQPTYAYNLHETPCEQVLQTGEFCCERAVQELFPNDTSLMDMEAESYLGIALQDTQGEVIGHLCVLNKQPIHDLQRVRQLLRVFAARAAAELERQRAKTSLEQLNQELEAKVEERTAALRTSEARYRALVDVIPDLLIRLHADGTYLDVIVGSGVKLTDPAKVKQGVNIYDTTSCEHAQQRMTYVQQALQTQEVQFYEYEVIIDGELHFEEARIIAIKDEEVLVIIRDITDRKTAEKALQESQQFIQTVLDTFPLSVFWKDRNLVYQGCNRNFLQDAGLASADELLGKTDYDLPWAATEADAFRADDQSVIDSASPKLGIIEAQVQAGGKQIWVEMSKLPLYNLMGEIVGVLGTYQDITDRKQAEAKVRSLLNRTQLLNWMSSEIRESLKLDIILQNSVNAIVAELPADICTFAWHQEDEDSSFWEVVREQKIAELSSWLGTYQVDSFPTLSECIFQDQIYRVDNLETLEDGQLKSLLETSGIAAYLCLPIHTIGSKLGSLQIGRISNEKTWQDEEIELLRDIGNQVAIAIHQAQLYEESQTKTAELQQSYQQLKNTQSKLIQAEKMSSLGQLVAGIAHEINNPVSFIYGNLTLASGYANDLKGLIRLYQENSPEPPKRISDFIKRADIEYTLDDFPKLLTSMETGAIRIRDIVQSLRTFSRLDQSSYKAVDIHENIDNTLVILQNRLNGRSGKPEVQVVKNYDDLPRIECYSGLLNQVFMNLLVNAIDAIEERPVEAKSSFTGCITITTTALSEEKIVITIQDNGLGIPPETQAQIFNPFFTTKPIGLGTGMGLSISYQIVTGDHQGQLSCRSIPGVGTEFIIELWQSIPYSPTDSV